ncbi:hypothetical protein K435DRAFT_963648 [Dendrothele bispora CBS 962.96]|uniref:Uncharacterized protein n=1 Tax=Dendrothele bispora (strain CBS 962.96) TaxID=1314807 RepID=A0A4S8MF07_DENBC|nr:hypothetical protein K435DRAFT_963648 [Dendrothele bispora CBS 962.96]
MPPKAVAFKPHRKAVEQARKNIKTVSHPDASPSVTPEERDVIHSKPCQSGEVQFKAIYADKRTDIANAITCITYK